MDENAMHRSARLKLKLMNLLMRFVAYKAKRNPNILLKMGGSIENACKMLEAQKVDNETRSRPLLAVRKTLVRESVLAQIIARNPKALDAYSEGVVPHVTAELRDPLVIVQPDSWDRDCELTSKC